MRFIELDGCFNFRDLGGYATLDGRMLRWGQLFRSDALHHLTRRDIMRLHQEIGLGTVVDLRSTAELESAGRGPLAHEKVQFHHIPLFDGQASSTGVPNDLSVKQAERYVMLADWAQPKIAQVLETLANSESAAVFHCAAGKDRTGVIAAIILGAVGVADEEIVADYALTTAMLPQILDRLANTPGYHTTMQALPADMLDAQPETMAAFLAKMHERFGPMREYARTAGLSEESLARLTERLVE